MRPPLRRRRPIPAVEPWRGGSADGMRCGPGASSARARRTAEFVRERILALARNPEEADRGPESAEPAPVAASMAPLIERMFRYTWFLATERRDAMAREGRGDELDKLVAEARAFQDSLRRGAAD